MNFRRTILAESSSIELFSRETMCLTRITNLLFSKISGHLLLPWRLVKTLIVMDVSRDTIFSRLMLNRLIFRLS